MQEDQRIVLSASVFTQVTDFLVKLPFGQVSHLIELLQGDAKIIQSTQTEETQQTDIQDEVE